MKFEQEYIIKYYDCNNGYISFPQIIKYMQEASTLHSTIMGCGVDYLNENNMGWILLENHCQIYKYPKMGEKIKIITWVNEMERLYVFRHYEIVDELGNIILQSSTKWIIYSFEKMRPAKISEEIKNMCKYSNDKTIFIENVNLDIDAYSKITTDTVLYQDTDTNWHMNNVIYIKKALESMEKSFLEKYDVEQCLVKYNHQLKYNEQFKIYMKKISEYEYIYNITDENSKNGNAQIYVKWRSK